MSASIREWKEFMQSEVWRDLEADLREALEIIRDGLESGTPTAASGMNHDQAMHYMRGQCFAIRNLLAKPEATIERLKEEQETKDNGERE